MAKKIKVTIEDKDKQKNSVVIEESVAKQSLKNENSAIKKDGGLTKQTVQTKKPRKLKREVLSVKRKVLKSKQPYTDTGLQGKHVKVLRRDNTGKLLVGLTAISLILIMVVVGQFFVLESTDPTNVIRNGTMINGVNVGGMASIDAEQLIYDVFSKKSEDFSLTINYQDKSWKYTKDDFKVNSEIHTIIEEAQKRNEVVDNYEMQNKVLGDLTEQGVNVNVAFNYIFVGLDQKIDDIISQIEYDSVDSVVNFKPNSNNVFEITEHKNGLRVNKEELYYNINEQFLTSNNIVVDLPTMEELPMVTKEDNINQTQLVSSFTTNVSDSTGNRKRNVKLALEKVNGLIVEPNQEISFNKLTGPHTESNGYKVATIIYKGKFVDGVGGGVCQASTTLYNALLKADVDILEVHKHTLPVKYVPLGLDAMVSEYVADLRFKNVKETPLYIQTISDSESVKVNIYGTPLGYQIKTSSETVATLKHSGDKIIMDTNKEYTDKVLFKGEQFRFTYPRDGFEAKAFVEYIKDGMVFEKKEIRHEYYSPQNGIIIEGVEDVPSGMNAITTNTSIGVTADSFIPTSFCP